MVFTNATTPVQKEPAAAFAKRDQPVVVEPKVEQASVVASAEAASAPATSQVTDISALMPAVPTTVEEVVALDYAPPQPLLTQPTSAHQLRRL